MWATRHQCLSTHLSTSSNAQLHSSRGNQKEKKKYIKKHMNQQGFKPRSTISSILGLFVFVRVHTPVLAPAKFYDYIPHKKKKKK
jgi:hypothetical protein